MSHASQELAFNSHTKLEPTRENIAMQRKNATAPNRNLLPEWHMYDLPHLCSFYHEENSSLSLSTPSLVSTVKCSSQHEMQAKTIDNNKKRYSTDVLSSLSLTILNYRKVSRKFIRLNTITGKILSC